VQLTELLLPESFICDEEPPPVYKVSARPFVKNSLAKQLLCVVVFPTRLLNRFYIGKLLTYESPYINN